MGMQVRYTAWGQKALHQVSGLQQVFDGCQPTRLPKAVTGCFYGFKITPGLL